MSTDSYPYQAIATLKYKPPPGSSPFSFPKGATLTVVEAADDDGDWLKGRTENGQEGVFPAGFVERLATQERQPSIKVEDEKEEQGVAPIVNEPKSVEKEVASSPPVAPMVPVPSATPATAPAPSSPTSKPTSTSPDAPPKPQSLKDRIAALNAAGAGAAPPPATRPKPSFARKPFSPPPPANVPLASNLSTSPTPPTAPPLPPVERSASAGSAGSTGGGGGGGATAMSAADAQESIGRGGSLKDRIAALQGMSLDAPGKAPKMPWKKKSTDVPVGDTEVGTTETSKGDAEGSVVPTTTTTTTAATATAEEQNEETATKEPVAITITKEVDDASPSAEGEPESAPTATIEQTEEERRSAVAARMATLGGQRLGAFGGPPPTSPPPTVTSPLASEKEAFIVPALPKRAGPPRRAARGATPTKSTSTEESSDIAVVAATATAATAAVASASTLGDDKDPADVSSAGDMERTNVETVTEKKPDVNIVPGLTTSTTAERAAVPPPEDDDDEFATPALPSESPSISPLAVPNQIPARSGSLEAEMGEPIDHEQVDKGQSQDEEDVEPELASATDIDTTESEEAVPEPEEDEEASTAPPLPASRSPPLPPTRIQPVVPIPVPTAIAQVDDDEGTPGDTLVSESSRRSIPPSFSDSATTPSGAPKAEEEENIIVTRSEKEVEEPVQPTSPATSSRPAIPGIPASFADTHRKDEEKEAIVIPRQGDAEPPEEEGDDDEREIQPQEGEEEDQKAHEQDEEEGHRPVLHRETESTAEAENIDDAPLPQEELDLSTPSNPINSPDSVKVASPAPGQIPSPAVTGAEATEKQQGENEDEEEQEEEDPEIARRRAIAARMAKLGGMNMRMGPMFPPVGGMRKPAKQDSSSSADEHKPPSREASGVSESEESTPPPPARRMPGIPTGGMLLPGMLPRRPPSPEPEEEGNAVEPEPSAESAEVEPPAPEETEEVPPPLPAGRPGSGPPPRRSVPTPQESDEAPPPLPPTRPPVPRPVATEMVTDEPAEIDEPEEGHVEEEIAPPLPPGRPAPTSPPMSPPTGNVPVPSSPPPAPPAKRLSISSLKRSVSRKETGGSDTGMIGVAIPRGSIDFSSQQAIDEGGRPDEAAAPASSSLDSIRVEQLQHYSSTLGAQVFAAAHLKQTDKSGGRTTADALVSFCLGRATNPLPPQAGYVFGAAVSTNSVEGKNKTEHSRDEPRAGDVAVFWDCKFKQTLSTSKVGGSDKPHVAIVGGWDGKKHKLRVIEVAKEGGAVEEGAYKMEDLKAGKVIVYRIVGRDF